jgi:hypothetical protein
MAVQHCTPLKSKTDSRVVYLNAPQTRASGRQVNGRKRSGLLCAVADVSPTPDSDQSLSQQNQQLNLVGGCNAIKPRDLRIGVVFNPHRRYPLSF